MYFCSDLGGQNPILDGPCCTHRRDVHELIVPGSGGPVSSEKGKRGQGWSGVCILCECAPLSTVWGSLSQTFLTGLGACGMPTLGVSTGFWGHEDTIKIST